MEFVLKNPPDAHDQVPYYPENQLIQSALIDPKALQALRSLTSIPSRSRAQALPQNSIPIPLKKADLEPIPGRSQDWTHHQVCPCATMNHNLLYRCIIEDIQQMIRPIIRIKIFILPIHDETILIQSLNLQNMFTKTLKVEQ